jgi:hypothetical protein
MKPLQSTYPPSHLCNPAFRYVPAASTDVAETIKRARQRIERERYMDNREFSELVRTARALDLRVD